MTNMKMMNPLENYHRLYCLHENSDRPGDISLVILDMKSKTIEVLNPCWGPSVEHNDTDLLDKIIVKFVEVSERIGIDFEEEEWSIQLFPHQLYSTIDFDANVGTRLHILIMLYHLNINAPIFFKEDQIDIARSNFCMWLLNSSLPV